MVYDPYTGTFPDDDSDSSLFAVPLDEGPFAIPTDDVEDDLTVERTEWSEPAGNIPSGTVGHISYDRGDNEIVGRPTSLDRDNGFRSPRPTAADRRASEELGERQRTDTGNRNVRRAIRQHEGELTEGASGGGTLATNVTDAAARLRESITGDERAFDPDSGTLEVDRGVGRFVKTVAAGGTFVGEKLAPDLRQRVITEAPLFSSVDFECEVYGAKLNAAGDWMLTLKIPFGYRSAVTDLSGAAGMNLKTHMELDL